MIIKEFNKELKRSDVLMMASEIVSNNRQIVVLYSRPESGKTAVIEDNYVFDGYYYCHTTHWYYKTSSDVRNSTEDYLTLEEMVEQIIGHVNHDLEDEESLRVFIETI